MARRRAGVCGHDADCLPVLFCDDDATVVAAAHGLARPGRRGAGAHRGRMGVTPGARSRVAQAAIGPTAFEVGDEVRAAFVGADPGAPPPSSRVACPGSGWPISARSRVDGSRLRAWSGSTAAA